MLEKPTLKSRLLSVWLILPQRSLLWVRTILLPVIIGCGLFIDVNSIHAEVLTTADFESKTLPGWTVFTTSNGTFGGEEFPAMVECDAAGQGYPSMCLQVKVGQIHFSPDQSPYQGGGLEYKRELAAGRLHLEARVMVSYHSSQDKRNLAGGLFEWVVDGQVVGMQDLGPIENGTVMRLNLTADHAVEAGFHTVQFRISRPFKSEIGQEAPLQLVDDLIIDWAPLHQEGR